MSDPHSIDGSAFAGSETDADPPADDEEERLSLADAMGDPGADRAERETGGDRRRTCAACGVTTALASLTRIAVRDDSGLSHAAVCPDCVRAAVRPPDCALCRADGGASHPVTRVRDSEPLGAVCGDCRDDLCGRRR
ncbi:hypothetical protein G9464_14610 [Halostella sp. JP-L12]|uniref:hypothetical protein n=1 Tax=Halostella TaxID=1843185 RepID=UPI000EF84567|nr:MULTISPECIES: hypothetical protein [Halostella]NHN48818.1 hypothetical protein [Halostella sp. JP-L12]